MGWVIVHMVSGMAAGMALSRFLQARNDFSAKKRGAEVLWGLALYIAIAGIIAIFVIETVSNREAERIEQLQERSMVWEVSYSKPDQK